VLKYCRKEINNNVKESNESVCTNCYARAAHNLAVMGKYEEAKQLMIQSKKEVA